MSGEEKTTVLTHDQVIWRDNPTLPDRKIGPLGWRSYKGRARRNALQTSGKRQAPTALHPHAEAVTVLSGRIGYGEGEKFDPSKGLIGEPRTFATVPANRPHFVWTESEDAVVRVQFDGPFGIKFVNASDDPCNK